MVPDTRNSTADKTDTFFFSRCSQSRGWRKAGSQAVTIHEANPQGAMGAQRRAHNVFWVRMGLVPGKASWRRWHLSQDLKDE